MRYASAFAAVLVVAFVPILASEPGQPLDCDEWVFVESGLSCQVWASIPCSGTFCSGDEFGHRRVVDNQGRIYLLRRKQVGECAEVATYPLFRVEIVRFDGNKEQVIAYLEERYQGNCCIDQATVDSSPNNLEQNGRLLFDANNGRLLIPLETRQTCGAYGCHPECGWIAAINGLTTTFEILQTYTRTTNELSFRVPYMPEGFQAADWFDTYHGDLATLGDFGQAQSLQCGYPAGSPSVGDYLTVSDPLPTPDPGQGRYYVTAVSYQGQRRYGRKAMGGVLSGRDPAVLPTCAQ